MFPFHFSAKSIDSCGHIYHAWIFIVATPLDILRGNITIFDNLYFQKRIVSIKPIRNSFFEVRNITNGTIIWSHRGSQNGHRSNRLFSRKVGAHRLDLRENWEVAHPTRVNRPL